MEIGGIHWNSSASIDSPCKVDRVRAATLFACTAGILRHDRLHDTRIILVVRRCRQPHAVADPATAGVDTAFACNQGAHVFNARSPGSIRYSKFVIYMYHAPPL